MSDYPYEGDLDAVRENVTLPILHLAQRMAVEFANAAMEAIGGTTLTSRADALAAIGMTAPDVTADSVASGAAPTP